MDIRKKTIVAALAWGLVPAWAGELLTNYSFGSCAGWYLDKYVSTSTAKCTTDSYSTDMSLFVTSTSSSADLWSVQVYQEGISLKKGYRYTLKTSGQIINNTGTSKIISLGVQKPLSPYYTPFEAKFTLANAWGDYSASWDNCEDDYSDMKFFINGGGNGIDFKLSQVEFIESDAPVNCTKAHTNQMGYLTAGSKKLVLQGGTTDPVVFLKNGVEALSVTPAAATTWDLSGESVSLVTFSGLGAGTYTVQQGGDSVNTITVSAAPYASLLQGLLKFYYYQRASTPIETPYAAADYVRSAGHAAGTYTVYGSTAKVSSSKGWYDAGDYGRYIVNSGISTSTLLSMYLHYPDYYRSFDFNIPADGDISGLPDLLAETKWNLDWMFTMQAADGGVYHKLAATNFNYEGMPALDNSAYYVVGKSTAAALDFAGTMAMASRAYASFDATYAAKCLAAAKSAYAWAKANPNELFKANPSGIESGEYKDSVVSDEFFFALVELTAAVPSSERKSYLDDMASMDLEPLASVPSWSSMTGMGAYTMATQFSIFGGQAKTAKDSLVKMADSLVAKAGSGYGVPVRAGDFVWGSNGVVANNGVLLLHAYYVTGNAQYYAAAVSALDYLLGRNPLGISYVTGFGSKTPGSPHHRISNSDGVLAPVPGMVVGGAQNDNNKDNGTLYGCPAFDNTYPARTYMDDYCSYSTNEVAINWNAPAAYLAGAFQAIAAGHDPNVDPYVVPSGVVQDVHAKVAVPAALRFNGTGLQLEANGKAYSLQGKKLPR